MQGNEFENFVGKMAAIWQTIIVAVCFSILVSYLPKDIIYVKFHQIYEWFNWTFNHTIWWVYLRCSKELNHTEKRLNMSEYRL